MPYCSRLTPGQTTICGGLLREEVVIVEGGKEIYVYCATCRRTSGEPQFVPDEYPVADITPTRIFLKG